MDRKTLFSSLFAATVVAVAVVKTAVDPDLRGLFARMLRQPLPTPVVKDERPRPSEWPHDLELVVEPSLVAAMQPWGTGESYRTEDTPMSGKVELVEFSAIEESTGNLFLRFRIGDWSCYQYFDIDLAKSPNSAPTIEIDARWWIDIRPIAVDANGQPIAGDRGDVDEPEPLSGIVGRVAIDSLDWTPGHEIAVKLALGCDFGKPTSWCWIEGGGIATIQPPK